MTPTRVSNGAPYQGFNRLRLWTAAQERGYQGSVWGTFKQWNEKDCHVRRGETQTIILFYKFKEEESEIDFHNDAESHLDDAKELEFVRPFGVFNIDQVNGPKEDLEPKLQDLTVCLKNVDKFIARTNADIRYTFRGGACYFRPPQDFIRMPRRFRFRGTEHSTATETFESTRLHELAHWSGAKHRLNRPFGMGEDDPIYAFEELVAELTAAFLCADLEIGNPPRPDHAQYIDSWLRGLKSDSRAISRAASKASAAARYLHELQKCGIEEK